MDTTIEWSEHRGDVMVRWGAIEALLGREHDGSADDDAAIVAALSRSGAPEWVADASGYTDEAGWYLSAPE